MNWNTIESLMLILVGIGVVVFNRQLTTMYISGYNRTVKRILGPVSVARPEVFWILGGALLILTGLAGLAGWVR